MVKPQAPQADVPHGLHESIARAQVPQSQSLPFPPPTLQILLCSIWKLGHTTSHRPPYRRQPKERSCPAAWPAIARCDRNRLRPTAAEVKEIRSGKKKKVGEIECCRRHLRGRATADRLPGSEQLLRLLSFPVRFLRSLRNRKCYIISLAELCGAPCWPKFSSANPLDRLVAGRIRDCARFVPRSLPRQSSKDHSLAPRSFPSQATGSQHPGFSAYLQTYFTAGYALDTLI